MEINCTIKKVVDDMGFCYIEVHFSLGSSSNNEAKNWKMHYVCYKINYGGLIIKFRVGHYTSQALSFGIVQTTWAIFSCWNQIIRHLPKQLIMVKVAFRVG
jgi:hypothetical protein